MSDTYILEFVAALNGAGVAVPRCDCAGRTGGGDGDSSGHRMSCGGSRRAPTLFDGTRRGGRKGEEGEESIERDDGELEDHGCGKL